MLMDTDVSPTQEINYLRSFTCGAPQRLVDNYRKRQMRDPVALLRDLWVELEKRFGSAAVISNTLLERLRNTATFSEHENDKLQQFADLCADIESQVTFLPGLDALTTRALSNLYLRNYRDSFALNGRKKYRIILTTTEERTPLSPDSPKLFRSKQRLRTIRTSSLVKKRTLPRFPRQNNAESEIRNRSRQTFGPRLKTKKFPEKKRRRTQERARQRVNIAPITKAARTTYPSVRPSQQKPWKNARSG